MDPARMDARLARGQTLRRRVFGMLHSEGRVGSAIDVALIVLIAASVISVILETDPDLHARFAREFLAFEWVTSIVFSVEYLMRLWTCVEDPRWCGRLGRLRYAASPMALIDLVSVLPFFLPMLVEMDLRIVRAIRLARLFRIFKIGRYGQALSTVGQVLVAKKSELSITFFMVIMLLVVASSLMYYAEHHAQPDKFSSIAAALWWGVVTLTTVGYGDVYPITALGKLLGGVIALLGVGIVAMPAGIIASGFSQAVKSKREQAHRLDACPRCGMPLGLVED